ncbi:MAG TPA: hypothetical protein ENJ87_05865 [Gammaproteobacteria bacterium]|nr:hypothetical protein [Gammaproteobacteria bacterium]
MRSNKLTLRLKEQIEALKGGVTTAANHLGKSRNTIYNWIEKGNAPVDQLERLGEIGVDICYIVTGFSETELRLSDPVLAGNIGETPNAYQNIKTENETHSTDLGDKLGVIVNDYVRSDTRNMITTVLEQVLDSKDITLDSNQQTQLITAAQNGYEQLALNDRTEQFRQLLDTLIEVTLTENIDQHP